MVSGKKVRYYLAFLWSSYLHYTSVTINLDIPSLQPSMFIYQPISLLGRARQAMSSRRKILTELNLLLQIAGLGFARSDKTCTKIKSSPQGPSRRHREKLSCKRYKIVVIMVYLWFIFWWNGLQGIVIVKMAGAFPGSEDEFMYFRKGRLYV